MKKLFLILLLTQVNFSFTATNQQENLYSKMQNLAAQSEEQEEGKLGVYGKTLLHTGIDAIVIACLFSYHLNRLMPYIKDINEVVTQKKESSFQETYDSDDECPWSFCTISYRHTHYPHNWEINKNIILFALESLAFTTLHKAFIFNREKNKRNDSLRKSKQQKAQLQ